MFASSLSYPFSIPYRFLFLIRFYMTFPSQTVVLLPSFLLFSITPCRETAQKIQLEGLERALELPQRCPAETTAAKAFL